MNRARRIVWLSLVSLLVALTVAVLASGSGGNSTLVLVGYAVPREALGDVIEAWRETPDGADVTVAQSYGASGDQARAVANGLRADVVHLSTELDVRSLVKAERVSSNWNARPGGAILTHSLVVFALRDGNPMRIRGWDDLIRPGVEVVTANPFTSGAAKWTVLAAYGAQRARGRTDAQAVDYVRALQRNVVMQARSGRDATNAFLAGQGDVLLAYENEVLLARRNGEEIPFTTPDETLLVEAPIAVTTNGRNTRLAECFVRFAQSDEAQAIFARWGFRPVSERVAARVAADFPTPRRVFRIDAPWLGGWAAANERWFDPESGLMAAILKETGGDAR